MIRFYENWPETSRERYAALFRVAVPGLDECTPSDVGEMVAGVPQLIEYAICLASSLVESESAEDEDDTDAEEMGMFAPPEEAVETAEEYRECDLIHALHSKYNYTFDEIYRTLTPEIDILLNGAERAEEMRDDGDGGDSTSPPAEGNRGGSHVSNLHGR